MKLYRTTAHSKYDLKVHIVFLPKYRKRILHGKLAETIRDLIRKISTELDVHIVSGKIAVDHVHLFVSYPPHLSVSDMVQKIKGKSAHHLLSIPEVRKIYWGKSFWARGYLAVSSGNITDEMIQRYIDDQDGEDVSENFEIES